MIDGRKNKEMARARAIKYGFKPKNTKTPLNDLTGKTFGKWKIIQRAKDRYGYRTYWLCKCECGREKEVSSQTLKDGTSSCCVKCSPKIGNVSHGYCKKGKPVEYNVWNSIKVRCRNPNDRGYYRYGDRGIDICDEWYNSFPSFINYVGKKPFEKAQLDRIDNDKGYEPGNVRWTTRLIQMRNTSKQPVINGKRICINSLAREINKCRFWVGKMLKKGFSPEELMLLEAPPFKEYARPSSRIDT